MIVSFFFKKSSFNEVLNLTGHVVGLSGLFVVIPKNIFGVDSDGQDHHQAADELQDNTTY